ncbi:CHAT domain-containing protein [Aquiflexum lacus]|uniref:CHAT domain-containing protein n=1 Tax=Aquiflexum lacus TaxID=2483805 RepID=UPI0018959C49|nr:CHAT domain-containing protein [Aquiflexum lacus]
MEKYDYKFNFNSLEQLECNGLALREILNTNNYLLRLLKNYSQITQIQVNQQKESGEGEEADETLRNLGLLLWNYIFSTNAENQAITDLEKIYKNRFDHEKSGNIFVLWFKERNQKIRFESLPWELLFWPDSISPDVDGQFLFNLEKNRIIRQGNPSENSFESKIPPTLSENENLKVLFVVLGFPEDLKNPKSNQGFQNNELSPFEEQKKEMEWEPLSYLNVKDELLNLGKNVKSEIRILINGKAKEIHINGTHTSEQGPEFITFSLLRDEITTFKPDIIHIITHGRCDPQTGTLEMMINSNEYQLRPVWDKTLSDNLVALFDSNQWTIQNKPKLIYLEVCQSGQSNFPIKLSERGIGIIIAMFYNIKQNISQIIAINFYKHILSEDPLEILEAFHKARRYSWEEFEKNELGFGLPLIYYNYDWDAHLINNNHFKKDPKNKIKKEVIKYISGIFNSNVPRQAGNQNENSKSVQLKNEINNLKSRKYEYGENVEELVTSSLETLIRDTEVKTKWPQAITVIEEYLEKNSNIVIEEYLKENSNSSQMWKNDEKESFPGQDSPLTSQSKSTSFPIRH